MSAIVSTPTPAGDIRVLRNPDPEHPGVWVELPGEGDRQLVLVEYDGDQGAFVIQVWDWRTPSEEPAYVQQVPLP